MIIINKHIRLFNVKRHWCARQMNFIWRLPWGVFKYLLKSSLYLLTCNFRGLHSTLFFVLAGLGEYQDCFLNLLSVLVMYFLVISEELRRDECLNWRLLQTFSRLQGDNRSTIIFIYRNICFKKKTWYILGTTESFTPTYRFVFFFLILVPCSLYSLQRVLWRTSAGVTQS